MSAKSNKYKKYQAPKAAAVVRLSSIKLQTQLMIKQPIKLNKK